MKTALFLLSFVFAANARADLQTVSHVDVSRYIGTWYQIAHNQLPFEPKDCACAQQTLGVNAQGAVTVYNSCNAGGTHGSLYEIRGTARNEDPASNSKFEVDFVGVPQAGQYWIIALDADYRYAVVSDPSLLSLYILSKTPELDPALYNEAVKAAAAQVPVDKLVITPQQGCQYP